MTTRTPFLPDIEKLVAGLTKAQRAAISRGEPDGHQGHYFIRWWMANGRTLRSLRKADLGTVVWSGVMLNETGLSVRTYLQQQEKAK